jgi:large subunit ribosomal protein L25
MNSVALKAFPRSLNGRSGNNKLRAQGRVPAVIYRKGKEACSLELVSKEIETLINKSASEHILVDLAVDGESGPRLALVQEVQHKAISRAIVHVDFHEVEVNELVTLTIPVETIGDAIGVKISGGMLEHVLFEIKVKGTPKNVPEVLTVDVSHMEAGQVMHIGELPLPEGVEALGDPSTPVLSIAQPKVVEAVAVAEPADAKKKGKKK